MESPKKIAHEIGGVKNDALRFGLHGVKSDIVGSHPLESSYESVNYPRSSFSLLFLYAFLGWCCFCFDYRLNLFVSRESVVRKRRKWEISLRKKLDYLLVYYFFSSSLNEFYSRHLSSNRSFNLTGFLNC